VPKSLEIDYKKLTPGYQMLFYAFKSREFLNRHLLNLEQTIEKQKGGSLLLQQTVQAFEQENIKLNEKVYQVQNELVQSYHLCERQGLQVSQL
jgi:hypothetical protein